MFTAAGVPFFAGRIAEMDTFFLERYLFLDIVAEPYIKVEKLPFMRHDRDEPLLTLQLAHSVQTVACAYHDNVCVLLLT